MNHSTTPESAAGRLAAVQERIRRACDACGRRPEQVTLVAVGKTQPPEALRELALAGHLDFAENYLQEAQGKRQSLNDLALRWHFIGHIQSNKCRDIAAGFDCVHSVDRYKIARRLGEAASELGRTLDLFLQVNISGESSKSGALPGEVPQLVSRIATEVPAVRVLGLMAIPAPCEDPGQQRIPFRRLRELLDETRTLVPEMNALSMGMSDDLEAAIAEGATHVRIGTALFGPRRSATH